MAASFSSTISSNPRIFPERNDSIKKLNAIYVSVQYEPLGLKKRFCFPIPNIVLGNFFFFWYHNIVDSLQALVVLGLGLSVLLETDSLDGDEAGGVGWLEGTDLVHGGLRGIVQLLGLGGAAEDVEVALVDAAADLSVDVLLGGDDGVGQELALWREVKTVVKDLGVVEGDKLVAESTNLTVEDKTLQILVSGAENGETWGLVASTGLESDETVLHDINTSNTVAAADGVGLKEELKRASDVLALGVLEGDWDTLLELDGEVLWLIWGGEWVGGELPHIFWWSVVWILKITGLVRAVSGILVHGPWLGLGGRNWDASLSGVLEKVVASGKAVVELWKSPWSDDLDVWLESEEPKLETDLVVTLSGAAVGDDSAALLLSDIDHAAGDDWASERGTQEVDTLVDGVTLDSWDTLLVNELLADVHNVAGNSSDLQCLGLSGLEVLLLADVGHDADNVITLLDEPSKDTMIMVR